MLTHVHGKVYVQLMHPDTENRTAECFHLLSPAFQRLDAICFVDVPQKTEIESSSPFFYGSLSELHRFDLAMKASNGSDVRHRGSNTIFLICGSAAMHMQCLFLIGSHLIMAYGLGFEETFLCLRHCHVLVDAGDLDYKEIFANKLRAFCCAKCLDWIDFRVVMQKLPVQIDKFVHDERCNTITNSMSPMIHH